MRKKGSYIGGHTVISKKNTSWFGKSKNKKKTKNKNNKIREVTTLKHKNASILFNYESDNEYRVITGKEAEALRNKKKIKTVNYKKKSTKLVTSNPKHDIKILLSKIKVLEKKLADQQKLKKNKEAVLTNEQIKDLKEKLINISKLNEGKNIITQNKNLNFKKEKNYPKNYRKKKLNKGRKKRAIANALSIKSQNIPSTLPNTGRKPINKQAARLLKFVK